MRLGAWRRLVRAAWLTWSARFDGIPPANLCRRPVPSAPQQISPPLSTALNQGLAGSYLLPYPSSSTELAVVQRVSGYSAQPSRT